MSNPYPVLPEKPIEVPVRRHFYKPYATLVIFAVTLAIFLLTDAAGGSTNPDILVDFGGAYRPYFLEGQYWRLVMPIFLHFGWVHFGLDMLALYVLGPYLERLYGYGRFVLLYIASGICSSALTMSMGTALSVGSSGAIFGLAGAMMGLGYLHREYVPFAWDRIFRRSIPILIVLNLVLDVVVNLFPSLPHIDVWGHTGGLIGGFALAWAMAPPRGEEGETSQQYALLLPLAVVALSIAFAARHYAATREMLRWIEQGQQAASSQQFDRATEDFQRAESVAPHDDRPHEALGALYLDQDRVADAQREFDEALRLSPDSPRAQLGLAAVYRQQGDLVKARRYLEDAIGKNPSSAEGQVGIADLCLEMKLYAEAIEHYQAALKLKPDLAVAHNNLAWLLATADGPQYRDPKQALEHAQRAVELSQWKQPEYIDTLAEALYANGQYAEAVKTQTKALALDPKNQEYQDHMARYKKAAGA